jgi:hypothetical protein
MLPNSFVQVLTVNNWSILHELKHIVFFIETPA